MKKHVTFIQGGGGKDDYQLDASLVASLQKALGEMYIMHYPLLLNDESLPGFGRKMQIAKEISLVEGELILAGHSLGASMLLKYLSEEEVHKKIAGIFLIATPFWSGDEDWVKDLKLNENFAEKLPQNIPVFFYHSRDDKEVPFSNLDVYRQKVQRATFREIPRGGHQLDDGLAIVANDIKSL